MRTATRSWPSNCSGWPLRIDLSGAAGLIFDRFIGEPPDRFHPVVILGSALGWLEQQTYRDSRLAGVIHLSIATASTAFTVRRFERLAGPTLVGSLSVGIAVAGTMLHRIALEVAAELEAGDLDGARGSVTALVGRDPATLDEAEIVRAVIESVAENTVDAVTATLFWAAVAGPTGVWVHRTVNTLDAMVGHRNDRYQRFGFASARVDDAMNWVPARLTALAVAVAVPNRSADVLRTAVRDGGNHPSPNGGVVEAAFAGALDITLGGSNNYGGTIEIRGPLGDGAPPELSHIVRTTDIARRTAMIFSAAMVALTFVCSTMNGRIS